MWKNYKNGHTVSQSNFQKNIPAEQRGSTVSPSAFKPADKTPQSAPSNQGGNGQQNPQPSPKKD